jgi:hypothetical protein
MRSYTVFQFTQRAIENRSTCHTWHACRRLPTPGSECHMLGWDTVWPHGQILICWSNILPLSSGLECVAP